MNNQFNKEPPLTVIVVIAFLIFTLVLSGVYWYLSLPMVYTDHLTGECRRVVPASAGSCAKIPLKFIPVITSSASIPDEE